MKIIILSLALIGAVRSFPKDEELEFKNMYVTPRVPASNNIIGRITNGHEAVPHSIPYQAYLIFTDRRGSRWLCGGSLISQNYVLTAGHCVDGATRADVYLGVHNTDVQESTRVLITSTSLRLHERYDESYIRNDIGLIQLPAPVQLNQNINVVRLPRATNNNYEGANARVSGWGLTDGRGNTSPVLREVNSTVISNSECNRIYGIVQNSQICISGTGGVGSCNGDSGGPLVAGNEQIGIVSYGEEYCRSGYPSAFTRVTSFLDWIAAHTDLSF